MVEDKLNEIVLAIEENEQDKFKIILEQLEELGQDIDEFLTDQLVGDIPLLHHVCKTQTVHPEMVRFLLDRGCDINVPSVEGTPLQIACRCGNAELVQLLLENGAYIIPQNDVDLVWRENSPFYIASLHGHYDVLKALMTHQPSTSDLFDPLELVKDESVRSCLLYAGCMGGDLNIVKMWFSPGMNIDHPREFVTSFEDCENSTPLYAACAGGHFEVANFLVDVGATLTKTICESFPEVTSQILEYCIKEEEDDDTDHEGNDGFPKPPYKAAFLNKELGGFHSQWLIPYTNSLVEINIKKNQIEQLPSSIPWSFPYLKILNASFNRLTKILPPEKEVFCKNLEEVHLNNNRLEDIDYALFQLPKLKNLNLSYNKLQYLVKTLHQHHDWKLLRQDSGAQLKKEWSLPCLTYLNVSHNELEMLPPDIKHCSAMTKLDASYNKMISFPAAWNCKMMSLDVSHNDLERFPVSAEQYWCGTLKCIRLDYNQLEEINESIVKLCTLTDLHASNNKINRLPSQEVWDCKQLYLLDLGHNQLNIPMSDSPSGVSPMKKFFNKRRSRFYSSSEDTTVLPIIFPQFLAHSLHELFLCDNNLEVVPGSICHLTSLELLDLSDNLLIKFLPKELGRLQLCRNLNLNNVPIENIPKDLLLEKEVYKKSKEIISLLRDELRQSQKYYKMKLVVLGKKDKGKTTLVNVLGGKSESSHISVGIRTSQIIISPQSKKKSLLSRQEAKPSFIFNTWDMAGDEEYTATQQCFLTQNSLYILVWDIWSLKDEIDKLGTWLYSIEARTPKSKVILVATNLDKNKTPTRDQEIQEIKSLVMERYGPDCDGVSQQCCRLELCYFVPVSCTTEEGISELKRTLYEIAEKLPDPKERQRKLMGRSIPKSYIELEKLLISKLNTLSEENKPPFLTEQDYKKLFSEIPDSDIDDQEIVNVTKFLVETGFMLHYNDQLKGLNSLYFLDPTWLCEVLSKILKIQSDSQLIRGGKIAYSDVIELYKKDSRYPIRFIEQYIQILERFEVALCVDNGTKLFVPTQLSKNPGIELHTRYEQGKSVRRLYQMPFIPSGLWNRFLSRIMSQVELLMSPDWTFKLTRSFAGTMIRSEALRRKASDNSKGLHISKKDMIYWRDGMFLRHDKGYFMLESVKVPQVRNRLPQSGILITIQSTQEDYSVMGMIVDELDDVLQEHYPGLVDFDDFGQPRIQRFAVCPVCYEESTLLPVDHFTVEHCSRIMLLHEHITCKKGVKVLLSNLVPELFMTELPKKFQLKYEDIEVEDSKGNFLGVGVAGSVYKGKYGNVNVALKFYHGVPSATKTGTDGIYSMDSGTHTLSIKSADNQDDTDDDDYEDSNSRKENGSKEYTNIASISGSFDLDEVNSYKALKAFGEMRQEVLLTSKLQHPCIVSFIGIVVRPKLLMALELAPFGSLRTVLDVESSKREPFNKYRDKDKVFSPLFSKDLTFKMVYQIAKGLEYLHKCCIVYRDLKSDNILVTNLDISSPVNVKLSDYGISRIRSSGGNLGLVGTPGYQAPEIIEGLAYDEKVDIFSFSMVIHEIISGQRPYIEYKNLAQITRAIKYDSKRPNLQDYNIDAQFPFLEDLMVRCWDKAAINRPSASQITSVSYMRSVQFLCQHKLFLTPDKHMHGEIDCVGDISEGQRHLLWLWEGANGERCYHILNMSTCKYYVHKEKLDGPTVTCMAKVGKDVWVGNEGKEIEVFRQECHGHPRRSHRFQKLGAIPTAIHFIETDKNCQNVFVALHDGRLQVYSPTMKETVTRRIRVTSATVGTVQAGWYPSKTLRLTANSISCLTLIPCQKEIWFGCEKEIVIVNTETQMVEDRIMISWQFPQHRSDNIQSLVYSDERVWCLLQNTASIIEFDVHLRRATHLFSCEEPQPYKMNLATYISNIRQQNAPELKSAGTNVEKAEKLESEASCNTRETMNSSELAEWADSFITEIGSSDSDSSGDEIVEKRPESSRPDSATTVNLRPPKIPKRKSSPLNSDSRDSTDLNSIPPPVPDRPGHFTGNDNVTVSSKANDRFVHCASAVIFGHEQEDGFVPVEKKSSTMPNLRRILKRPKVNSVTIVKDTMWIGRSFGDILVININQKNKDLFEHGEVIAVLKNQNQEDLQADFEIENLVPTGDLVVSFAKENLMWTDLIAWEAYDASKIHNIQQYWLAVKQEESKLNKSKKQTTFSVSEIGTV